MKMKTEPNCVTNRTTELETINGYRLGTIVKLNVEKNRIWIDYQGNPLNKPILASLGTPWVGSDELFLFQHRIESVKIEFYDGNPGKPIIRDLFFSMNEMNRSSKEALKETVLEIDADELILTGRKQVVIRCGETKMTFKADGSTIIQEADQIDSSAKINNKVKGGSILLN